MLVDYDVLAANRKSEAYGGKDDTKNESDLVDLSFSENIKDFPASFRSVMTNPTFVLITLAGSLLCENNYKSICNINLYTCTYVSNYNITIIKGVPMIAKY